MTKVTFPRVGIVVLNLVYEGGATCNEPHVPTCPQPQGDFMKRPLRSVLVCSSIGIAAVTSATATETPAQSAVAPVAVKPAASAVANQLKSSDKAVTKGVSSVGNKSGDNMYPGISIPPPKPPKKEALEAAGAAKAKAGQ